MKAFDQNKDMNSLFYLVVFMHVVNLKLFGHLYIILDQRFGKPENKM
jgi:hypothetical protein